MKLKTVIFSLMVCNALLQSEEIMTLSKAYDLALHNEPKLKASSLKAEATGEYVVQNKSRLYPQLQGNLAWGRYEYEADYLRNPVKESYASYSLSATQPLFHPELWRGIDEAKSKQKAAKYQFHSEAQQLGLELAKTYFNLIRTQQNVALLEAQKKYYQTKYQQLEAMLKIGLTNRIDLLEAKIRKDKATAEWLREQKVLHVASLRLEQLISTPVGQLPVFDFSDLDAERLFMERKIWEEKLQSNPRLISAMATNDMARHQLAMREYDHYPKVDLSLARKETYTKDTVSHKYDNQAILQMSIPLYQGGYTQSKVRESLLMAQSAQKELEYTQLQTTLRFEELWADRELNTESLRLLRESEKSAELYLESVEKGHASGLKSLVDVLEAQSKLYEVKRDYVDAAYTLVENYLGLLDVCGELNSDNIAGLEKMVIRSTGGVL